MFFRSFCICLLIAGSATAQRVADFPAALARAKRENLPLLVLFSGSDWNTDSKPVLDVWTSPDWEQKLTGKTLLLNIDRKENPDDAARVLEEKNKACKTWISTHPTLVLYDSQGRQAGMVSGAPGIAAAGGLHRAVGGLYQALRERDDLWQRAEKENGIRKAALIGEGLDRIGAGAGKEWEPERQAIAKADPKDSLGYLAKYQFVSREHVNRITEAKDATAWEVIGKELDVLARNPRLSASQRQEVHAARFALFKKWPGHEAEARRALEEMEKADPKSVPGKASANRKKMLAP